MVKKANPRHGSMQFWPRKRAKKLLTRVRTWTGKQAKPLGFVGYKVGMAHMMGAEQKGKLTLQHSIPVTLIECPPIKIFSVRFYQKNSIQTEILSPKLDQDLKKRLPLPKEYSKKLDDVKDVYDQIRILTYTQPKLTSMGKKVPDIFEVALGGSKEEQLTWVKENLEKEINVKDVFEENIFVDIHAVTKGKGYQGVVKRFGVNLKSHRSEKGQRGVGARSGGWKAQAHMMYRVAQPGKMGFHQRTEYNKQILKMEDTLPEEGIRHYGKIKNNFIIIKGSIAGSKKRPITITNAIRAKRKPSTKIELKKLIL
jgi:large subunit ribosomal protein L3